MIPRHYFIKKDKTRAYNLDGTKMQCKHLPTLRILQFLYDAQGERVVDWRNEERPTSVHFSTMVNTPFGKPKVTYTVAGLFPEYVPQKLIRAKLNSLQRKGLVDGGDFSPSGNGNRVGSRFDAAITEKGKKFVEDITHCNLF